MIQWKAFVGSIAEIESEFNKWAASLPDGVNVTAGPLVRTDEGWVKEVLYLLPQRSNGRVMPASRLPENVN